MNFQKISTYFFSLGWRISKFPYYWSIYEKCGTQKFSQNHDKRFSVGQWILGLKLANKTFFCRVFSVAGQFWGNNFSCTERLMWGVKNVENTLYCTPLHTARVRFFIRANVFASHKFTSLGRGEGRVVRWGRNRHRRLRPEI